MKKNNSLYKTIIKTIVKCTSENETLLDFKLIPNEKKKQVTTTYLIKAYCLPSNRNMHKSVQYEPQSTVNYCYYSFQLLVTCKRYEVKYILSNGSPSSFIG